MRIVAFLLFTHKAESEISSVYSYMDINHIGKGPHSHKYLISLIISLLVLSPNAVTLKAGIQQNLGDTIQSITHIDQQVVFS